MKTNFKQFLLEKYLDSSHAPIYHWTDAINLKSIFKHNKLGHPTKDGWDSVNGITKFAKDDVSFTRDKNYRIRGKNSSIRFAFDPVILKQKGYKIKPYVDRSVVRNIHDEDRLPQHDARFEAEERVSGPINLDHGLIAIQGTPEYFKEMKEQIAKFKKHAEEDNKQFADIRSGKLKFSYEYWLTLPQGKNFTEDGRKKFKETVEKEQAKDPDWAPKWFSDRAKIKPGETMADKLAKEYQDILDRVTPL